MKRAALLLVLVPALAGWEPLWRRDPDVEDGNKAYREQRYDDAVKAYDRAKDEGLDPAGLAYDRGTALEANAAAMPDGLDRDAAYADALKDLARAASGPDLHLRARSHFNRGNVLMKQHKLDEAIEAYKDSLRADSKLDVARMNLELALRQRQREQRQQQQQGQGQGQGQQGQGQQSQGQGQGGGGGGGGDQQQQGGDQQQQGGDQQQQGGDQQQQGGDQQQQQGQGGGSQTQDDAQTASGAGSGSDDQDPTAGNQQQPRRGNPSEDDDNQTPDTPVEGKLDALEHDSRDQRREQIRRRTGDVQLETGEDW